MRRIRVLVVDDSVVVRRLVTNILSEDPAIEVVGAATNGRLALVRLTQLNPDAVTLDIEMPEMDGIATLIEIRKSHPHLPVIMFSTLTERGAAVTLDALTHGASDYVTKPTNVGSLDIGMQRIREQLLPKLKALCGYDTGGKTMPETRHRPQRTGNPQPVEVLVIGVSTGGPNALGDLLPRLPANFPVPIVIVQHMPPIFTQLLADRLDTQCQISVSEGKAGDTLMPGHAYLAPGDYHMALVREGGTVRIVLHQQPPENSVRPAADVLFRSAAEIYGAKVLAVVLTGMGSDGLRGCETIYDAGGRVLAQDEASAVVWGMPGCVVNASLADKVLPLAEMAGEIVQRTGGTAKDSLLAQSKRPDTRMHGGNSSC